MIPPEIQEWAALPWGGWFLLLLGIAGCLFFFINLLRAAGSRRWPTTTATVVISEFSRNRDDEGNFNEHFRLVYDFTVDGRLFQGKQVRIGWILTFGSAMPGMSQASDAHSRYTLGSACTVHYNPANPNICCLEPGGEVMAGAGFLASVGLLIWGLALIR